MNVFWTTLQQRRLTRRRLLGSAALGGAGLAAAAIIGCGGDEEEEAGAKPGTAPAEIKRGAIVELKGTAGQTLSPNSTAGTNSEYHALYDPLTRLDYSRNAAPGLATKWELEKPDRWVFHLRDAQWSDGKPFTAEDVKFTYDYILNPDNKSALISRADTVKSVEIIDKKTVAINTKAVDPILPKRAFFLFILPKHYLGDPALGDQALGTKAVGTGAYVLDDYSRGSRIKLKASPSSWRGTKGVDAVDTRLVPDDQTRIAAYEAGDGDILIGLPLPDIQRIAGFKNTKMTNVPAASSTQYDVEYFDVPYNDVRVRLAFAQALDYAAILKTVYFGVGDIAQGQMLSRATFGFNPNIKPYKFDPDEARRLLKQAGVDKLNTKMEFKSQGQEKPQSEAYADYLKDIGVSAELIPIEQNVWRDGLYGRRKRAPFMTDGWNSQAVFEASFALQWMHSANAGKFYGNKDFDAAYEAAIQEPDDEKRKRLYWKTQEIMHDDPPQIWLVEVGQRIASRADKIANFQTVGVQPLFYDDFVLA